MFRAATIVASLLFLLMSFAAGYWLYLSESLWRQEQRVWLQEVAASQAAAIERRLSRSLSSTYILAQEVRRSGGQPEDFDRYASEVMRSIGGISNLQLAPDGIVSRIYPLVGNERALGHDILKDDKRRQEAHLAVRERHLTLAGPFELVQGGVAVIGRNPVFLGEPGRERFWGFVSALIYLDDLLKVTELDELGRKGFNYQLARVSPENGELEAFAGSANPLDDRSVAVKLQVPNGRWILNMSRLDSDPHPRLMLGVGGSFSLALVLSGLAYRVLREPERLRLQVRDKTHELERLAFHDGLTGLVNRHLLQQQLQQTIRNVRRQGGSAALMYLDLDDFKRINDSMGHAVGDRLLQLVAQRLQDAVRDNDIVARLGGDEFAVLSLDVGGPEDVCLIADKIIAAVRNPIALENRELVVGTTIGITLIPEDGRDVGELLRNADLALYASKQAGKGRFAFFDREMQLRASRQLALEEALHRALAREEFFLAFQPIVSLENGQPVLLEALLRWRHPQQGLLNPGSFIEVAEQTGLIVPIGQWVLRSACRFVTEYQRRGLPPLPVAINISARQLRDPSLAGDVEKIILEEGVDPSLIELEVTESQLMEDLDCAVTLLDHFKQLGLGIAIDDFGTGYSSLAQLKRLPVDRLKIDRSFIQDLEVERNDRQIVDAIIAMSHKLGLPVVAEGIETERQFVLLRHAGCDMGQGYMFGAPEALNAATAELPGALGELPSIEDV